MPSAVSGATKYRRELTERCATEVERRIAEITAALAEGERDRITRLAATLVRAGGTL